MRILLLGATGQIGQELQRTLAPLGEVTACDRHAANLEDKNTLTVLVRGEKPDIIVNAAAYTAVDQAESEPDTARAVNAEAVKVLAELCRDLDALLVHYSTDYVFDGEQQRPYIEQDPTNPLGVYGQTKLAGEHAVAESQCKHLIFRTSWVYASKGHNFPNTILKLAQDRDSLAVVADQYGAPTSAELIADVTALCLYRIEWAPKTERTNAGLGTYHLTARGKTNWHNFAKYLVMTALEAGIPLRTNTENIQALSSEEYPTAARRPKNSLLDTQKLTETFGIFLPSWQYHARRFVAQLTEQEAK